MKEKLIRYENILNQIIKQTKTIRCEVKTLLKNTSMAKHIGAIHEGNKSFKCDTYDYSCSQKGNMNTHVALVHEGKKPFKRDICDYSSFQKIRMNTHVASVHEGKELFECDICD